MINLSEITSYSEIPYSQVKEAKDLGLLVHHVLELSNQQYSENGIPCEYEVITRDEWFAATPKFVQEYHQDCGMWEFID